MHEDFQNNGLPKWDIQVPVADGVRLPLTSTFPGFTYDFTIHQIYSAVANYYSDDTFAQFTRAWDVTQTYFYNVMANIDNPGEEGENWETYESVWCHWNEKLYENIDNTVAAITGGNYRYFLSAGKEHTVLMSNDFYTMASENGTSLTDWIEAMLLGDSAFVNLRCTGDCGKPVECPDCP